MFLKHFEKIGFDQAVFPSVSSGDNKWPYFLSITAADPLDFGVRRGDQVVSQDDSLDIPLESC